MHQLLGLILISFVKISCSQFVPFNLDVSLLLEEKKFVPSYEEATKVCEANGAFLAVLNSPELFNFAYEKLEDKRNDICKRYPFA